MGQDTVKTINLAFDTPARHKDAVIIVGDAHFYRCGLLLARQIIEQEKDRAFDICVICSEDVETPDALADGLRIGRANFISTDKLPTNDRISIESYLRIFLPHEMTEYRRLCYLDADMYLNRPGIQGVFEMDLDGYPLAAVSDLNVWMPEHNSSKSRNYRDRIAKAPDRYFNAGFLLIDVQAYNAILTPEGTFDLICDNVENLDLHDQTFLNMIFSHQVKLISPIWNFPMLTSLTEALEKADPIILHFVGNKPWHDIEEELRQRYFPEYRNFLSTHFGYTDFTAKYTPVKPRNSFRKHKSDIREWVSRKKVERRLAKSRRLGVQTWMKMEQKYPRGDF
ncbi:glycosyltransferase family 8 protein [Roseovarius dicentrarchi]|uniref:glycosyltransferase family 8 protein n=1 Tax=Roseovarius dicentrarchi TaxID=2250573 RepID=UPI00139667CF|nr:glycosyltransferase [Roseovarius dicentrarchi]